MRRKAERKVGAAQGRPAPINGHYVETMGLSQNEIDELRMVADRAPYEDGEKLRRLLDAYEDRDADAGKVEEVTGQLDTLAELLEAEKDNIDDIISDIADEAPKFDAANLKRLQERIALRLKEIDVIKQEVAP